MGVMYFNLQRFFSLIFALYTLTLLINLGKAEVCFQDVNCTSGEFCNFTKTDNSSEIVSMRVRNRHLRAGVCAKCIDCAQLNRQGNRNKNTSCATHVRDCGECLPRHEPSLTHEGYHVDCKSLYPTNNTNNTDWNTDWNSTGLMSELNETEVAEGDNTAGMIAGGVCIGIAAIVILAFLTVFLVKYFSRKRKPASKDPETETTTELQELKPQPVQNPYQNETLRDPIQIEEKQKI